MASTTDQQHDVVVVVVPLPAQGHLHPALQLSCRLSSANIPVYYVSTTAHVRQAHSRAAGWNPLKTPHLNFIDFPVTFDVPPPNPDASIKFPSQLVPAFKSSMQLRTPVTDLVNKLASISRRVIVVHDFLTSWVVQDVPKIPNTECYCLQTVSAYLMFTYTWEAARPPVPPEAEVVLKQVPSQDGCAPPEVIEFARKQINVIQDAGNIYSTSRVIDGMYLDLTEKMSISKDFKNWALGPFNPVNLEFDKKETAIDRHYSLEWLDKQPASSVIFVSFGSTTSLSEDEIRELAIGRAGSKSTEIYLGPEGRR
ncbi:hypothetical protein AABB24_038749 [Solanum stoloniferum]|uniref:Glycosyltransferase N-terminal domain-containing protein n=1 Tax=Solanum stoloniferum TaxID=62892 RepID=A0ABD2QZ23_9SOLN